MWVRKQETWFHTFCTKRNFQFYILFLNRAWKFPIFPLHFVIILYSPNFSWVTIPSLNSKNETERQKKIYTASKKREGKSTRQVKFPQKKGEEKKNLEAKISHYARKSPLTNRPQPPRVFFLSPNLVTKKSPSKIKTRFLAISSTLSCIKGLKHLKYT